MISAKMNARTKSWSHDDLKQNKYDAYPNAEQPTRSNSKHFDISDTWAQKNGTQGEKNWSKNKPIRKHNTSHTNATCHAYPNADQTAHNNLQQIDISEAWDPPKGRVEKKSWNHDNPKTSTTHVTQMQHVPHTPTQTKPLTTTCNKMRSARIEVRK